MLYFYCQTLNHKSIPILSYSCIPSHPAQDYCITLSISAQSLTLNHHCLANYAYVYNKLTQQYRHGFIQHYSPPSCHQPWYQLILQSPLFPYRFQYHNHIFQQQALYDCLNKLLTRVHYPIKITDKQGHKKPLFIQHAAQFKTSDYKFMQQLCQQTQSTWVWDSFASIATLKLLRLKTTTATCTSNATVLLTAKLVQEKTQPAAVNTQGQYATSYEHNTKSIITYVHSLQAYHGPHYGLTFPYHPKAKLILLSLWQRSFPVILARLSTTQPNLSNTNTPDHSATLSSLAGHQLQFNRHPKQPTIYLQSAMQTQCIKLYRTCQQQALQFYTQAGSISLEAEQQHIYSTQKDWWCHSQKHINISAQKAIYQCSQSGAIHLQATQTHEQQAQDICYSSTQHNFQLQSPHIKSQNDKLNTYSQTLELTTEQATLGLAAHQQLKLQADAKICISMGHSHITLASNQISFTTSKLIIHTQQFNSLGCTQIK